MNAQIEIAMQQARIAAARELREKAIADLPEAIARGQELREEYERLRGLFVAARDRANTLSKLLANLSDRAHELHISNPDTTQVIPSRADQVRWIKEVERVSREQTITIPEAHEANRLRDQYQREALIAAQAFERQEAVVRNLKQNRDDPEEQYHQQGARGGVTVPF